jgi:hypothetical protein
MPRVRLHFESVGPWTSHVPLQVATESQPWTGFEPYSHSRPCGEHDESGDGKSGGQPGASPLSTHPAPQPPLLLVLPPPLLPLLPVPPLLPLLPPPLLLLLAPLLPLPLLAPPLLPLLPPLVLPVPPLLLPLLPVPPSLPSPAPPLEVNAPPQANEIMVSGTINALAHGNCLMRSIKAKRVPVRSAAVTYGFMRLVIGKMCHLRHADRSEIRAEVKVRRCPRPSRLAEDRRSSPGSSKPSRRAAIGVGQPPQSGSSGKR